MWPISHFASPRWFHKISERHHTPFRLPDTWLTVEDRCYRHSHPFPPDPAFNCTLRTSDRHRLPDPPVVLGKGCQSHGFAADEMGPETISARRFVLPVTAAQLAQLTDSPYYTGAHWECEAVFEYSPSGEEKDDENDSDETTALGGEDDVEDALESAGGPRNRISSRASAIIAPLAPPSSSSARGPSRSPPPPASRVQAPTPAPTASPSLPISPTRNAKGTHAHFSHERLPSNASGHGGGFFGGGTRSSTSPTKSDSGLSTSPPAGSKYTSSLTGLAELYQHREGEGGVSGLGGLRRRMSVGGRALAPTEVATEPGQAELKQMVERLAETLARLEAKIDGKED